MGTLLFFSLNFNVSTLKLLLIKFGCGKTIKPSCVLLKVKIGLRNHGKLKAL